MNADKTLIAMVVDRSGSMDHLQDETITGINKFIADQQALPGECDFTLVQFSTDYAFTYNHVAIRDVKPLTRETYKPAGYTALLDAMGRCIDETGAYLAGLTEAARPGKVIVMVATDGHENSSREYTAHQVATKVRHQQERYKWEIVFMGAQLDAIAQASGVGLDVKKAIKYASGAGGMARVYSAVSANAVAYRSGGAVSMNWSEAQRLENADPPITSSK